jgi:hypothetical protein
MRSVPIKSLVPLPVERGHYTRVLRGLAPVAFGSALHRDYKLCQGHAMQMYNDGFSQFTFGRHLLRFTFLVFQHIFTWNEIGQWRS